MSEETIASAETKDKKRAIDAPRSNYFNLDPNSLTIIGIDTKHTGRGDSGHPSGLFHPLYDERVFLPRNPQHVAFAKEHGIPYVVLATKEGDQVIPVEGRQRILDLREGNKLRVKEGLEPYTIKVDLMRGDATKKTAFMIAGNSLRTEENPVHAAMKLQAFIDLGNSEEAAAVVAGCTVTSVRQKLSLLELDAHVQKAVSTGKVTMSAALQLKSIPHDQQRTALKTLTEAAPVEATETPGAKPKKTVKPGKKVGAKAVKSALGKTVRPGLRTLSKVAKSSKLSVVAKSVLLWVLGEITLEAASESCKGLGDAVKDAEGA